MDIKTLKNSLCNVAICATGVIKLVEKDRGATLKEVDLCDVPQGALVVKMDPIRFNKLFQDKWGFNKHSDYLIITETKLVLIELKSKKDVDASLIEECEKKFLSDNSTLSYADIIFKNMLSKNPFFEGRDHHYVLLYQAPSIQKGTTTNETLLPNNTPQTFRSIPISDKGTISFYKTI